MNSIYKAKLEMAIDSELWMRVGTGSSDSYYVEDVKSLVKKMKEVDYSLVSVPEEFAEKYEKEYANYVSYIVSKKPKQTLFISEPFIRKNVEFACTLFDDLVEQDPKNFTYIDRKISDMDERASLEKFERIKN